MDTFVNRPKGTPQYIASGLSDIAEMFDKLAKNEHAIAEHNQLQREKIRHTAAARAYEDCARILRETVLVQQ